MMKPQKTHYKSSLYFVSRVKSNFFLQERIRRVKLKEEDRIFFLSLSSLTRCGSNGSRRLQVIKFRLVFKWMAPSVIHVDQYAINFN